MVDFLDTKAESIIELLTEFPTDEACLKHIEAVRWSHGPRSPFDRESKVYRKSDGTYRCKSTGRNFTVFTGTIFEHTRVSLRKWFIAIWYMTNHKTGISSHQLAKDIAVTQKTAWHMLHKIRLAMQYGNICRIGTDVEIDETLIGGKNRNRHRNKKVPHSQGRSHIDKTPVVGMIQRGGILTARMTEDTTSATLSQLIRGFVREDAVIYTDENAAYNQIGKEYQRYFVDHSRGLYGMGKVTTNRIESAWTHLKRIVIGIYRHVPKKHLQNYVNEFVYRFNFRDITASRCFNSLLLCADPKWTYDQLHQSNGVTATWY